jgi:DNA polymerase/3'-5' exonuclease PolX
MSEGKRFANKEAMTHALEIVGLLIPISSRIAIAGSLRRCKPDVGDIEIVCIPRIEPDLFGNPIMASGRISHDLEVEYGYELLKDGEHFKQFYAAPELKCDLFITTPEQWGVIFAIRTGSAEFSHKLVTPKKYGGYLPSYLNVKDGRVWNMAQAMSTPEEKDFFDLCGLWVEPKDRI